MGWFDDNLASAQAADGGTASGGMANSKTDFGNATLNYVADLMRQYWGIEPSRADVSVFGTGNLDDRYRQAILQTIQRDPRTASYGGGQGGNGGGNGGGGGGNGVDDGDGIIRDPWRNENPNKPPPTGQKGGQSGGADMASIEAKLRSGDHDQVVQGLRDLAAAKGSHPKESSYETWANYILNGNGESKDSNYFIQRVMNDDPEFNGGQPNYLSPWGGQYDPPKYEKPPDFVAPDPSQVLDDPAIKLQLQESLKTLQRSALSRGTLLTGGTATDIDAMAQQVASAGYDKIYNRAAAEDQAKYGRSLDAYGIARDNALASYNDRKGTYYDGRDSAFQKLLSLAGLGSGALGQANALNAGAAGSYGNALANGTNTSNGYGLMGSDARASQQAAPNAWGQAFGAGAANAANAYGVYRNGQNSLTR